MFTKLSVRKSIVLALAALMFILAAAAILFQADQSNGTQVIAKVTDDRKFFAEPRVRFAPLAVVDEGRKVPASLDAVDEGRKVPASLDGKRTPASLDAVDEGRKVPASLDGKRTPASLDAVDEGYRRPASLAQSASLTAVDALVLLALVALLLVPVRKANQELL
jgi:hypothetical protein